MSGPREIELKLEVDVSDLARLTGSPLLRSAATTRRRPADLVSVYFDTKKLKLRRNGVSLRLRRVGRRLVQTVKQEDGARAALFDRSEWEQDINGAQPDLDAARDTALAALLTKKLRRNLKPVFETRVRRKVLEIQNGGSEIALCIDKGVVAAGRKSSPLCELELELKQGQPSDLFQVAKALAEKIPLQLPVKSKADRGYELLTAAKPAAVKAPHIEIASDADVQRAFQTIARACLHQLVANQRAMLNGEPEGLHQMRVALRRLRAAISLFSDLLADPQTNALKAEFKWITGELGPARELDIFLNRVVKPIAARSPRRPGVAVVTRELRQRRKAATERARTAVESPRFRAVVLDTAAWIESGDWMHSETVSILRDRPIASAAADELHRRWKAILKKGRKLGELDAPRRHKLRIQVKKLRYASEFFGCVFPGRKSTRRRENFVARLSQLQEALGDLNDIAVHKQLSERLVNGDDAGRKRRGERHAETAFAAGRLSGHEEARNEPMLKEAGRAHAAFAKAQPFWT